METRNLEEEKDRIRWKKAKKRVAFRNHFIVFLTCQAFFWALWFFTDRKDPESGLPWPVLPALGWGFGLFWHFLAAYVLSGGSNSIEKEYEKLKRKEKM